MNAFLTDIANGADGAGKFTFQSAQMIDILHEGRGAKGFALVEDFVADRSAQRQAQFGGRHAAAVNTVAGDVDFLAAAANLEGNVLLFQHLHDAGCVRRIQVLVEQRHVGLGHAARQEDEEHDDRQGYPRDQDQTGDP